MQVTKKSPKLQKNRDRHKRSVDVCLCPFTWKFPWRGCCYAASCFIGIHILVTFSRVPSEFDSFAWEFAHPLRRYLAVISPEFINRSVINFVYILTSNIEKSNRIMFSLFLFHKKHTVFLCIRHNFFHNKWQKINICPFTLFHSQNNCKIQEGGFYFFSVRAFKNQSRRLVMLFKLIARVDVLWSIADAAGVMTPPTPRRIRPRLNPITNR